MLRIDFGRQESEAERGSCSNADKVMVAETRVTVLVRSDRILDILRKKVQ